MTPIDQMTPDELRKALHIERARAEIAERRADERLAEAHTDGLTRLLNAQGFTRRAEALDQGLDQGWYVRVDLDGFKSAQDKPGRGHAWGDRILVEFSDWLMGTTRERDFRAGCLLLGRTGGDEFTIRTELRNAALGIRDRVREWASTLGHGEITASAGIGHDQQSSDVAMYIDKRRKKEQGQKVPGSKESQKKSAA